MLGSINPYAVSDETGNLLLRATAAAKYMKGHWSPFLRGGTEELQDQVVRATAKFFLTEPAELENIFEKRALLYYLSLAKGLACECAGSGREFWRSAWKKSLPELDRLEEECRRLPIPNPSPGLSASGSEDRLPMAFFSGPDAEDRRDLTEQIIDATAEEIRRMREELPSSRFQLLRNG